MQTEKRRKTRNRPQPYNWKAQKKPTLDGPATSAKPIEAKKRDNLTLNDWLLVLEWVASHPNVPQDEVVAHFRTRKEDALLFSQSTLSRKIKQHEELKAHAQSHPAALSGKRVRIVTRPDVERALFLWVKHLEEKGETVSGPMLQVK